MKLKHLFENKTNNITTADDAYDYIVSQEHKGLKLQRVPELEPLILLKPTTAYFYARDVIEGEWPEAEPIILTDPQMAAYYAIYVKKKRWSEAEEQIKKTPLYNHYLHTFPEARTSTKDVPLRLGKFIFLDIPNTITDEQVKQLFHLLHPKIDDWSLNKLINDRIYDEQMIKYSVKTRLRGVSCINLLSLKNNKNDLEYLLMKMGILQDYDESDFEDL